MAAEAPQQRVVLVGPRGSWHPDGATGLSVPSVPLSDTVMLPIPVPMLVLALVSVVEERELEPEPVLGLDPQPPPQPPPQPVSQPTQPTRGRESRPRLMPLLLARLQIGAQGAGGARKIQLAVVSLQRTRNTQRSGSENSRNSGKNIHPESEI